MVFNVQRFSLHDGPGIRTTVFLKGCPLSCWWCANPESLSPRPELGFTPARCNECKKCIEVCPEGAVSLDRTLHIDRSRCNLCGKCLEVCYPEALTIFGREMEVEEVFELVKRDEVFYQSSGGGVTVSGGEPLMQPSFVFSLFKRCKEAGIDTCLDTSGYGSTEALRRILPVVDRVLFDIKHIDPAVHRKYTGKGNGLILRNARVVASSGVPMVCRIPLIPGVNDTRENIEGTINFLKELGSGIPVELLPYHRLGKPKYEALDKPYPMEGVEPPTRERVEEVKRIFESFGMRTAIVM
jgi:pyruvate formate lyase activating enzyme